MCMDTPDALMARNLHALANVGAEEPFYAPTGRMSRKKGGLTRSEVIQTFQHAFELIGGTPRLAVWADTNPTDFFKLYGRLLPSASSQELDGDQLITIRHVLPPPPTPTPENP